MPTFFRTHWIAIAICLAYTLIASGGAYYFASSSAHKHEAAMLKMAEELKSAKETQAAANAEALRAKAALGKEKELNASLKIKLATGEQERENMRLSMETMTLDAAKAAKTKTAKTASKPVAPSAACVEKKSAAEKAVKEQMRALQAFQADLYARDSALREKQKKLDDTLAKIAEEKRKLEGERAEYRWPHNGSKGSK